MASVNFKEKLCWDAKDSDYLNSCQFKRLSIGNRINWSASTAYHSVTYFTALTLDILEEEERRGRK